jgi:hypothetical protein
LVDPTSWLHRDGFGPTVEVAVAAVAFGELTTEIAERVETAKTKAKKW